MPKGLVWIFSKKYIAGESVEDAVRASKELNQQGIMVTLDILGEFIKNLHEAKENRDEYLELIDRIEKEGINGNYSLKPTSFGLLLDEETCYSYIRDIVAKAASYGNFIRIDMEDSQCVDMEIRLYRRLHEEFPENVGLVVQAYLHRTLDDLKAMQDMKANGKVNYRLCKGIYVEPEKIAFKKYEEINEHFLEDLEYMFANDVYPGIATHDKNLVEGAYKLLDHYKPAKDHYEFQMLYGVTPDLRKSIVEAGHRMRVYIPFGKDWFGYSTRRLKENPKMASHIIKALFVHS
jgi:proline dehydrogenase